MLQQQRPPKALRAWGVAADDFWYPSMRKPPYPMCATRLTRSTQTKKPPKQGGFFKGPQKGSELKSHHLLMLFTQAFDTQ